MAVAGLMKVMKDLTKTEQLDIPGEPRKCDELFFFSITLKSNILWQFSRNQLFENQTIGHYATPWIVKVVKMQKNMDMAFF